MEHKLDREKRLADYIYDDLGPEEIVEFEDEISKDPRLSESYRLNMQVKEYLQAKLQLEDMRSDPQLEHAEKLSDIVFEIQSQDVQNHESHPDDHKRKRIRNMAFAAAIAASVIIIIAVGIVPGSIDQDRLFERYYEPIEASNYTQRGQFNELYGKLAESINNYMEGNYEQSISLFNELASEPAIRPEVELFTGLSYMGLGEVQRAHNILQISVDGNTRYLPEALWYLSLCCLKEHKVEKAVVLLGQLQTYDGMYKDDAQALLKKLRRFQ
jgi:hypothetical protein